MRQPEGFQTHLLALPRESRQYVLELGVLAAEQRAEVERLHNGIAEVERIVASNEATIDLDRHSNRWYVFTPRGECNDDRHADTLLDLIRRLGGSTDDQRTASDTTRS